MYSKSRTSSSSQHAPACSRTRMYSGVPHTPLSGRCLRVQSHRKSRSTYLSRFPCCSVVDVVLLLEDVVTLSKLWLPQGLQAARQTSRSSRTASCQANVTLSKLWLQAYPKLANVTQAIWPHGHHIDALPGNVMLQQDTKGEHRGDVVEDDVTFSKLWL